MLSPKVTARKLCTTGYLHSCITSEHSSHTILLCSRLCEGAYTKRSTLKKNSEEVMKPSFTNWVLKALARAKPPGVDPTRPTSNATAFEPDFGHCDSHSDRRLSAFANKNRGEFLCRALIKVCWVCSTAFVLPFRTVISWRQGRDKEAINNRCPRIEQPVRGSIIIMIIIHM